MQKLLTERDKALFESLHQFGILSTSQIRKIHFTDINKKTALRRLCVLRKEKWIFSTSGLARGEYIWGLTKKGANHLGSDFLVGNINKNMLNHDLSCNEFRFVLDRYKVAMNWKSAHLLKHLLMKNGKSLSEKKDSIPDWLCSVKCKDGNRVVAIEIEFHLKSRSRRKEVLYAYVGNKAIRHLWFVFPNDRFGQKLFESMPYMLDEPPKDWLCWSNYNDILTNFENAKVHFMNGHRLIKDWIIVPPKPAVSAATTPSTLTKKTKNIGDN